MHGPLVLPEDLKIVPLAELPPEVRAEVQGEDGAYALTRPLSRVPSKIIDAAVSPGPSPVARQNVADRHDTDCQSV